MAEPFITADNVTVRYPVPLTGAQQSALGAIASTFSGGAIGGGRGMTYVEALRGITLDLRPGDRLGLIGRNGAGKSTMLRMLGGLLPPSRGVFEMQGSSMNMLSLGAGMDADLSGYENIRRMSRLLGIPRKLWKQVEEDVVDFTDLGTFLAMPVRTYSAGMSVRLAFAMATAYPRDILVIDEIIGAGDAHFFEKAKRRMDDFVRNASILVMASHGKGVITEFCNRCIYLERGTMIADGDPETIWQIYMQALVQ
jgi:lipopolysaccharide transport system ATP-binding protein